MDSHITETTTETLKTSSTESCATEPTSEEKQSYFGDASKMGLWLVVLIFIIIWTIIIFCGFNKYSKKIKNRSDSKSCDEEKSGCGAGALGAFLVWIIGIILLIAIVFQWGWAGLAIFLVLAILLGVCVCAGSSWDCDDKKYC